MFSVTIEILAILYVARFELKKIAEPSTNLYYFLFF